MYLFISGYMKFSTTDMSASAAVYEMLQATRVKVSNDFYSKILKLNTRMTQQTLI